MGQAKRRGNLDERIKQATSKQQEEINKLKLEHELPGNAEFCGYVVLLSDSDEFLASLTITADFTQRGFAKTPELAKVFKTEDEAKKAAKHCKQDTAIAVLFDVGEQLYVIDLY